MSPLITKGFRLTNCVQFYEIRGGKDKRGIHSASISTKERKGDFKRC